MAALSGWCLLECANFLVDALMPAGIHGAMKVSGPTATAAWMPTWITSIQAMPENPHGPSH